MLSRASAPARRRASLPEGFTYPLPITLTHLDETSLVSLATGETVAHTGVADLLRLFGAGSSGSILLALGDGPLRTKDLTTRVSWYAPRTVYRYAERLVEIGALNRVEEAGVPSKVLHSLTDPCGLELHDIIRSYALSSSLLERLGDGRIVPHSWTSLTLLAGLWESGMFEALDARPCTTTQLARIDHDLSFHQVSRRVTLFVINGLIGEVESGERRRHFGLTPEARQATGLIAALGRWRERHLVAAGAPGLTPGEASELLRAALPLVVLPGEAGKSLKLTVTAPGGDSKVVWAGVEESGEVVPCPPRADCDSRGRASVGGWTQALLGDSKVRSSGDTELVEACVAGMAQALWAPEPPPAIAHA